MLLNSSFVNVNSTFSIAVILAPKAAFEDFSMKFFRYHRMKDDIN